MGEGASAAGGEATRSRYERLRRRHGEVLVVLSPPRCSSTAIARLFWEHPAFRWYAHEPYETTYYDGRGVTDAIARLESPLDIGLLSRRPPAPAAEGLIVKEMPYQVGERLADLVRLATRPVVFLLRDPRLAIASRMRKKREVGASERFPEVETGWRLLRRQIEACRDLGVETVVLDTGEARRAPLATLPPFFAALGLDFDPGFLTWRPCPEVELDNLGGRHRHLYRRVLASAGFETARRDPPELSRFPEAGGWREHVRACVEIYRELTESRVRPLEVSGTA